MNKLNGLLSVTGHQTLNDGKSAQRVPCNICTTKLPLEKIVNSVNLLKPSNTHVQCLEMRRIAKNTCSIKWLLNVFFFLMKQTNTQKLL